MRVGLISGQESAKEHMGTAPLTIRLKEMLQRPYVTCSTPATVGLIEEWWKL